MNDKEFANDYYYSKFTCYKYCFYLNDLLTY